MSSKRLNWLPMVISALCATTASAGGINVFTDRSLFIDHLTWDVTFETRGNGDPLVLGDLEAFFDYREEWRNQGVRILAPSILGPAPPAVINWGNPLLDEAVGQTSSGSNMLWMPTQTVRFEFPSPIRAFGFSVFHLTDRAYDTAYVYGRSGALLGTVELDATLLDQRVEGAPFGLSYDVEFGFVGVHSFSEDIDHVTVLVHSTNFDDLRIGFVPEPSCALLVLATFMATYFPRRQTERLLTGRLQPTSFCHPLQRVVGYPIDSAQPASTGLAATYSGNRPPSRLLIPRNVH